MEKVNKTELKNFAIQSRRQLIDQVKTKALMYGIDEKNGLEIQEQFGQLMIKDKPYPMYMKPAFSSLKKQLEHKGYKQLVEEVAYTWFNRIIAIRYMEIHDYLPERVNVLSSSVGRVDPDILFEYETMDLPVKKEKVREALNLGDTEEAYRQLFIAQCNALSTNLPFIFESIQSYTELLLPNFLLDVESVIGKLINNDELTKSFNEIEVIGWLYQYYNSEPKDVVFGNLKNNKKIQKYDIPAATQLFTPKWIVKYMVENSLGQIWIENNPNSAIKNEMPYYIEPSTSPEYRNRENHSLDLQRITIIDPCVGSGHMLVYAFELLYKMYEEVGYPSRDIPKLILENNLYGLDIDPRAVQLSSFALVMKAREYNSRFLKQSFTLNISEILESNDFMENDIAEVLGSDEKEISELNNLFEEFYDAKEYGSIIKPSEIDCNYYLSKIEELSKEELTFDSIYFHNAATDLIEFFNMIKMLKSNFDVVITNPPYMGSRGMNDRLRKYLDKNYPLSKMDLFSVLMERSLNFSKKHGLVSMITMESWMFITKFEKMRDLILDNYSIYNLLHMPYEGKGKTSLGINFGTVAFILRNSFEKNLKGVYQSARYVDIDDEGVPLYYPLNNDRLNVVSQDKFDVIKGRPMSYWMSDKTRELFAASPVLEDIIDITGSQHKTANNDKYLRYFWEVNKERLNRKWVSYAKGGDFRKWFGNNDLIVDWSEEAQSFYKKNKTSNLLEEKYRFRKGITWTASTNGKFSARILEEKGLFDMKGPAFFPYNKEDLYYILGYINSEPIGQILDMYSGTSDYQVIDIKRIPFVKIDESLKNRISELAKANVELAERLWNYNENVPSFSYHSILNFKSVFSVEEAFQQLVSHVDQLEHEIEKNEVEINNIINTILEFNLNYTENHLGENLVVDYLKSFMSYFVGVLFGRFRLPNDCKYSPANIDHILLTDTHYFKFDIYTQFTDFISGIFGTTKLEENLHWIANTLNTKLNESPEMRIRRYFSEEFFAEHYKMYKKCPIYWLVDSGKNKGLRTLIYMHRYQTDTMATIRFEHLQEIQSKYLNEITDLENRLVNPSLSASEKKKLTAEKNTFEKKMDELREFDKRLAEIANEEIEIDLEDGVKVNYEKFYRGGKGVLAKIK